MIYLLNYLLTRSFIHSLSPSDLFTFFSTHSLEKIQRAEKFVFYTSRRFASAVLCCEPKHLDRVCLTRRSQSM